MSRARLSHRQRDELRRRAAVVPYGLRQSTYFKVLAVNYGVSVSWVTLLHYQEKRRVLGL